MVDLLHVSAERPSLTESLQAKVALKWFGLGVGSEMGEKVAWFFKLFIASKAISFLIFTGEYLGESVGSIIHFFMSLVPVFRDSREAIMLYLKTLEIVLLRVLCIGQFISILLIIWKMLLFWIPLN